MLISLLNIRISFLQEVVYREIFFHKYDTF